MQVCRKYERVIQIFCLVLGRPESYNPTGIEAKSLVAMKLTLTAVTS